MAKLERVWLVAHEDAYCAGAEILAEKRKNGPPTAFHWLERQLQKLGVSPESATAGLCWRVQGQHTGPVWRLGADLMGENGPAALVVLLYLTRFVCENPDRLAGELLVQAVPAEEFLAPEALRLRLSAQRELGRALFLQEERLAAVWESLYGPGTAETLLGRNRVLEAGTRKWGDVTGDGKPEEQMETGVAMTYALGALLAGLKIPD